MAMRTIQLDPLWRTSIGFDRMFDLLEQGLAQQEDNYPPYDIARTGDDTFEITLAVAGFKPDDISVTAQQNVLTITGRGLAASDNEVIYRGIAGRPFERRFNLADHVEVTNASLENGLLRIELERRVPEAMKPRRIAIGAGKPLAGNVKSIEQAKAA
jgi:molecular chaperone IbpA